MCVCVCTCACVWCVCVSMQVCKHACTMPYVLTMHVNEPVKMSACLYNHMKQFMHKCMHGQQMYHSSLCILMFIESYNKFIFKIPQNFLMKRDKTCVEFLRYS